MAEEEENDRVAELHAKQQQDRVAKQQAKEEAAKQQAGQETPGQGGVFGIPRDEIDANVSRFIVKPEPLELLLLGVPWFNLKLIWGKIIKKGKSRFIAPPSFDPWKFGRLVPSILAVILIIVVDIIIGILLVPSLIEGSAVLFVIGEMKSHPIDAAADGVKLFGSFAFTLFQAFGETAAMSFVK